MSEELENLYFTWLCAKVEDRRIAPYKRLLKKLHQTEFVWKIIGDDNRVEDGRELRREFLIAADAPDHREWRLDPSCSVLEMLIAFSRRAEYMTDEPADIWFWEFIDNLGLKGTERNIDEILYNFIWRTYEYSGHGGLTPLDNPLSDQRDLQIWHQFCDYLIDKDRLP
jgi:hypothetical protein